MWFYWSEVGNLLGCPARCQMLLGVWGMRVSGQYCPGGVFRRTNSCRTKKLEKTTEWDKIERAPCSEQRNQKGWAQVGFLKRCVKLRKTKGENWVLWVEEQCEHSLEAGS